MRKTALLLGLGVALLVTTKRNTASRKSLATEIRYDSNFTAVWTALNKLMPIVTADNGAFLAGLGQMTTPTWYVLSDDEWTGDSWGEGERAYVNSSIDSLNDLIGKFQRQGFML